MTTWTSRNIAAVTTMVFFFSFFLFWHQQVTSLCCSLSLSWILVAGENQHNQEAGRGSEKSEGYVAWSLFIYLFFMSNGCIPEYSSLCRIRGRTDLLGPIALSTAREDGCTFLLALTLFLVPVFYAVRRWRPLQVPLQVWMLSGAYFLAQDPFPLYLLNHSCVSTYPWHLEHLKERVNTKFNKGRLISKLFLTL